MDNNSLRAILAQNIKHRRKELHLTQAKLAEYAELSEPYMNDIERCQTWVSDKTLVKLADALHTEVYRLFQPLENSHTEEFTHQSSKEQIYALFNVRKTELYKQIDMTLEAFCKDIIAAVSDTAVYK